MSAKTFREIHITGEGFRTMAVYRLFFKAALAEVRHRHAEYEAAVKDWYENGDGRPRAEGGEGYAYPECIHGSNPWTDYDNICGWCEDASTVIDEARLLGREQFLRFNDRWEWVNAAPGDLRYETRNELLDWAISLFPKVGA